MALNNVLKSECEKLFVDELLSPKEIIDKTGISTATFYRWCRESDWETQREISTGLRSKLGRLLIKLIDEALAESKYTETQRLYALLKMYELFNRTSEGQGRVVYVEDAEKLMEILKEMEVFKPLLEDLTVLSELAERMKAKLLQE